MAEPQPIQEFDSTLSAGFVACYTYMEHVCETCHELSFEDCDDVYVLALLLPSHLYTAQITDKFGNHYQISFTTDIGGGFYVSDLALPVGFFNKWMGDVEMKVTLLPNSTDYVDLNISGTNKKCIIISIIQ